MFDIGAAELLVIVIVAILVIGPKDMPLAMRTAGRWIGKIRKVSSHFRTGIDAMVREAELEDLEKKWKAQNDEIMRKTAGMSEAEMDQMRGPPTSGDPLGGTDDSPADHGLDIPAASAEAAEPAPEAQPKATTPKPATPPRADEK